MIPKEERSGEIHRLYDMGYTKEDIAIALGIAYSTVMRILKEGGKSEFRKRLPPGAAEQAVLKAFKDGYTFTQIPGVTGVSTTTASEILKKHNLIRTVITYAGKTFGKEAEMRAYRNELRKKIDSFVLMGMSDALIASKLNIPVKVVRSLKN